MQQKAISRREMFWTIIIVLLLHDLLLFGLYLSYQKKSPGQVETNPANRLISADYGPAPDFFAPNLDGHTFTLSDFQGQAILVNFWGTWCQSCIEELPEIEEVYRRYREKGFTVLAIAVEAERDPVKRREKVERKARELGLTMPVLLGDDTLVRAFGGNTANFPQAYLIDQKGRIRLQITGARKGSYWEDLARESINLKSE